MSSNNNTLLRLSTTDPNCIFDNDIQEDLILKPNSQIALQNITLIDVPEEITIENFNDEIEFGFDNVNPKYITKLSHAKYSTANYLDLLDDDIQLQMNKTLDNLFKTIGMEWRVFNNDELNKVEFVHRIARPFNPRIQFKDFRKSNISNKFDRGTGGTQGTFDSFLLQETPFVRGAGFLKIQIEKLGTIDGTILPK